MSRPLSGTHFKPQPRIAVSAMPSAVKLASLLAESVRAALSGLAAASWRVTVDQIEEPSFPPPDAYARTLRFESVNGSLTTIVMVDRPAISGLVEAMMGGNGTEAPFDMGDRPLSQIEIGAFDLCSHAFATEMAQTMSSHFGRPFSFFEDVEKPGLSPLTQGWALFRFIVNVFGYSGEIRFCMARSELAHQILDAGSEADDQQDTAARQRLQIQVGQSDLELTVTLGPEMLSVEDITELRPGKLIELSSRVSTPVKLWSGGIAAFEGSLARSGDRLAVIIAAASA